MYVVYCQNKPKSEYIVAECGTYFEVCLDAYSGLQLGYDFLISSFFFYFHVHIHGSASASFSLLGLLVLLLCCFAFSINASSYLAVDICSRVILDFLAGKS